MKISIKKMDLLEGLNSVGKAITGKSNTPILKGVFLQAKKNALILLGSDSDLSICKMVSCEVIEEGTLLVDEKILAEIIRKLPNGDVKIELTEDDLVKISCNKTEFSIVHMNADEYHKFPTVEKDIVVDIPQNLIKDMVKGVAYAAAVDSSKPILKGILFEIEDKKLNIVALDGYRVAMKSEFIGIEEKVKVVVDAKNFLEISKLLSDTSNIVRITITKNTVMFNFSNTIIVTRLLEGEYVNYKALIPGEEKMKMQIDRLEMLSALERVSLMAKEGDNSMVKFTINNESLLDSLVISSASSIGKSKEEVAITLEGDVSPLEIAFNSRYLIELLKNTSSDILSFNFMGELAPAIISDKENTEIFVVLPVRIKK